MPAHFTCADHREQEIDARIRELDYAGCAVCVESYDIQPSSNGNVLVVVIGEITQNGIPRRFSQTFILALEGANKYYVLNDVLRHIGDAPAAVAEAEAEEEIAAEIAVEAAVEAVVEALAAAVIAPVAAAVETPEQPPQLPQPRGPIDTPAQPRAPRQAPAAQPATAGQPRPPVSSYAGAARQSHPAAKAAVEETAAPAAAATEEAAAPAAPAANAANARTSSPRPRAASSMAAPTSYESSLFLRIDASHKEEDLRAAFGEIGAIKSVSVVRGKNIAFLEYADAASAARALSQQFVINDKTVGVQKRLKPSAGDAPPRAHGDAPRGQQGQRRPPAVGGERPQRAPRQPRAEAAAN